MFVEVFFLIAGVLAGWGIAQIYYRRAKADSTAQLEALRADIERVVAEGLVSAVRNAAGQIKGVSPPNPPTDFKLY